MFCYGVVADEVIAGSAPWSGRPPISWTWMAFGSGASASPTTSTTSPAPTTTAPRSSAVGTRDNPIPLGATIPGNEFNYTVVGFEPAVDGLITQINQYNDPAPPDYQYVRVRVRAEYDGTGPGDPLFITINLVDEAGTTYLPVEPCCDPEIGLLTRQAETFAGGSVEGWLYYVIPNLSAFGKFLAFDPTVTYTDVPGGVGFFAVN